MRIRNRVSRDLILAALVAVGLDSSAGVQAAAEGPVNLDFEKGDPGKAPDGWKLTGPAISEYEAKSTDEQPKSGTRCALVARTAKERAQAFDKSAMLGQRFDAAPYRGQRVRFRAAVRSEVSGFGNYAQLLLRISRKDQPDLLDNMRNRAITQKDWREYDILAEVPQDAVTITLGLELNGNGRAWLDAASFEVVGKA